jgi:hypothetical protein
MAYSPALTAEAENAPPAISHVGPKTHTPFSRVKERGQIFCAPQFHRFL